MNLPRSDEFSLNSITKQIRQDSRSVRNRLQSILYDAEWVREVQEAYQRPLVPNERCGLWYVEPSLISESCYFKSTDGHNTQWSFSSRRLNFHLFDLIVRNNGIIIVDSTRRGKTVPDALSKTIPIWCATLNYVMFGNSTLSGKEGKSNWLFLPKQIISESEQNSIMKMIPQFAEELLNLKTVTKEQLLGKFQGKYLRPMWVYPGMVLPFESPQYDDFYPIINCVASRKAQDGTVKLNGFNYVQGAADDHELWADCLTPKLFWGNIDLLKNIELSDSEILKVIGNLEVKKSATSIDGLVNMTDRLSVGKVCGDVSLGDINDFQTIILLSKEYSFIEFDEKKQLLKYPLLSNKKGSNDLRKFLPEIIREVNQNWDNPSLILCDTGSDLSIGVVLALLALHYDLNWTEKSDILITKDVLKRHLAKLLEIKKVNPSRATLQSINSFLM